MRVLPIDRLKNKFQWYWFALLISLFLPQAASAQFESSEVHIPEIIATFSLSLEPKSPRAGEHARILVKGRVVEGWHIYSLVPADDEFAPLPTKVTTESGRQMELVGPPYESNPVVAFDPVIGMELSYHENSFYFFQNLMLAETTSGNQPFSSNVSIRYQACSDKICLPPKTEKLTLSFTSGMGPLRTEFEIPRYDIDPLPFALEAGDELGDALAGGVSGFVLLAILSGFLALLTPCVFPMIPVTMAFFTKQENTSYTRVLKLASLFGLGIIGTYTLTGMGLSVILGATGAIQLATNGYVNFAIGLLFLVFAFSLMGFFTLSLPANFSNRMDRLSRKTGGSFGIVLMGLVFTLTSFTCTVQFVGTMLIAASRGHWLWPVSGMLIFSTVFALPFFLLGLLPRLIQSLKTRSGAWLTHMKVVLGLIELAAAFKFFSNADLVWQWGIIDRDVVLYAWIILAFLVGLFLLGSVRIHETRVRKTGVIGFSTAFLFLFLGSYLIQGLQGTPLNAIVDAYLPPPLSTSASIDNVLSGSPAYNVDRVHALPWMHDLNAALKLARLEDKKVFVDFTGYTCVNCRWMEKYIFADPEVLKSFKENFILVQLFTDGGDNYQSNQGLQVERFHTVALPFYVVLDARNQVLARHAGIMASSEEFLAFLQQKRFSGET